MGLGFQGTRTGYDGVSRERNEMTNWEAQFNEMMFRATLSGLVMAVIATVITAWVTYLLLKAAIRDGLLEYDKEKAPLLKVPTRHAPPTEAPTGFKWVLVPEDALPNAAKPMDMRAD